MSYHTFVAGYGRWRTWAGGWPARIVTFGVLLAALACFALAGLVFWRGRPWAVLIYAENPYAHLLGGVGLLAAWHFLCKGYDEPAARWKSLIGKTVLLGMSLGFSFLLGEVVMRGFLMARQQGNSLDDLQKLAERAEHTARSTHPLGQIIQPSIHDAVVYELKPGLDTLFGGRTLRTNASGFRDSLDYPMERSPGSVRIVGLGDSGMFGWDVDQDQDYMAVLEDLLNQRNDGRRFEVINMAVPGYNTQLEAETLRFKGLAYRPDLVVVGWCENDGQLPFFLLEKEDYTRRDVSFLHLFLCRRDDFKRVAAGTRITDLRNANRKLIDEDILNGTEATGLRKAFGEIKRMSEEHGFKLLVFGPLGHGIRNLLSELGIAFYNTREQVDASKYPANWDVHFMHPSPEGHRVLGEHLATHLGEGDWLIPSR